MPLYLALAIFVAVLVFLFVAAKHRKDLPQKTAPMNQQQGMALADVGRLTSRVSLLC